jgi:hypothetical protein
MANVSRVLVHDVVQITRLPEVSTHIS